MTSDLAAERWYTTDELATMLGVDPSTIRRWRTARPPQGPPFVRVSDRVTIYARSDINAWLHRRRVDPSAAA